LPDLQPSSLVSHVALAIHQLYVYGKAQAVLFQLQQSVVHSKLSREYCLQQVISCARLAEDTNREIIALQQISELHTATDANVHAALSRLFAAAFAKSVGKASSDNVIFDTLKELSHAGEHHTALFLTQRAISAYATQSATAPVLNLLHDLLQHAANSCLQIATHPSFPRRFYMLTFIGDAWPMSLQSQSYVYITNPSQCLSDIVDLLLKSFPGVAVYPPNAPSQPFRAAHAISITPLLPDCSCLRYSSSQLDNAPTKSSSSVLTNNDFGVSDIFNICLDDDKVPSNETEADQTSEPLPYMKQESNPFEPWLLIDHLLPCAPTHTSQREHKNTSDVPVWNIAGTNIPQASNNWTTKFILYELATDIDIAAARNSYGERFAVEFCQDDDDLSGATFASEGI